ncbi:hypothetical protein BDW66DRAFT_12147 [Aspergillus desertorum]
MIHLINFWERTALFMSREELLGDDSLLLRSTTIRRRFRPLNMRRLIVYGMFSHHNHIKSAGCISWQTSGDTKYPQRSFSGSVVISGRFTNACTLLSWQHGSFSASLTSENPSASSQ